MGSVLIQDSIFHRNRGLELESAGGSDHQTSPVLCMCYECRYSPASFRNGSVVALSEILFEFAIRGT